MNARQFALVGGFVALLAGAAAPSQPVAPRRPVTDTYFGVAVADDYQYLERTTDAEVVAWAAAQNDFTRSFLDGRPERQAILDRVIELTHDDSERYYGLKVGGDRLFAIKRKPPAEQPFLVVFAPGPGTTGERTLVDPNELDSEGATSIDFFVPSLDGTLVAVSLSRKGSEDGTLHVYDTASGRALPDEIPRVNGGTAGGSVAWSGSELYYTRYPHPGERPDADLPFYQQIWRHSLGTPVTSDSYVLGQEFPRIAEIELHSSDDGRHLLAEVSNGDGGEYAYWLKGPAPGWTKIADFKDQVVGARFGPDALFLLSRRDAPRKKVLRVPLESPVLADAGVVVPQSAAVITSFLPTDRFLYVVEMLGGPSSLRVYDRAGGGSTAVEASEISTFSSPVRLGGDEIAIERQSYTTPPAWYSYRPGGVLEPTPLAHESPADYGDCEVLREFATAGDGTKIPISIVIRKGTPRDGSASLLLYGYGSYGRTMSPWFSAHRRIWIEQGGIYAVANIRGGGAYGDAWHRAANLENKKVSMDDFAACARHLVKRRFTSADRLAIEGGSAGGLLVFGVAAHHPDAAAAVIAHVGIADALRTELSPNGEFNTPEFGTVRDERQFRGMLGYSPYHNVADGTVYPAVLATTGMNDPRVEPWHAFKMVARLQASGSPNPVLLRVSYTTGHGGGTSLSDRDRELADAYTFLFATLNVPYRVAAAR